MNNRNKFLKRGICVCAVSRKCQLIWFGLIDFHTDLIAAAGFLPVSHNFIVGLSDQSFFAVSGHCGARKWWRNEFISILLKSGYFLTRVLS